MAVCEHIIDYGAGLPQVHACARTKHAFMDEHANNPAMGLMYNPDAERRATPSLLNFFESAALRSAPI